MFFELQQVSVVHPVTEGSWRKKTHFKDKKSSSSWLTDIYTLLPPSGVISMKSVLNFPVAHGGSRGHSCPASLCSCSMILYSLISISNLWCSGNWRRNRNVKYLLRFVGDVWGMAVMLSLGYVLLSSGVTWHGMTFSRQQVHCPRYKSTIRTLACSFCGPLLWRWWWVNRAKQREFSPMCHHCVACL